MRWEYFEQVDGLDDDEAVKNRFVIPWGMNQFDTPNIYSWPFSIIYHLITNDQRNRL